MRRSPTPCCVVSLQSNKGQQKLIGTYKPETLSFYDKHTDLHSIHSLKQGKKTLFIWIGERKTQSEKKANRIMKTALKESQIFTFMCLRELAVKMGLSNHPVHIMEITDTAGSQNTEFFQFNALSNIWQQKVLQDDCSNILWKYISSGSWVTAFSPLWHKIDKGVFNQRSN